MAAKGGGGKSDNGLGWFLMLIVIIALMAMIWYYQQENIRSFVRWIRYMELWLLDFFVDDAYRVRTPAGDLIFGQWFPKIAELDKSQLTDELIYGLSLLTMTPLKYVFAGLLFVMGLWAMFLGPNTNHRRKFGLDELIAFQASNFPTISPFVDFNPNKMPYRSPGANVPADLPLFAEALSPEEWIAFYSIPTPDGKVDAEAAAAAFTRQLGKPWRGYKHLAPYQQILLASFCLKAARKRAEADQMLADLAACWRAKGGLSIPSKLLRQARGILANKDLAGTTLAKCNQHAFEMSALLRALATAREQGGVLAPATFVWLRGYNRAVWYPLNNLGRQAFHMEALGAMAHYKSEKLTQRPIPRPHVDDAVKTITEYMASDRARPVPALDYSKSKRKSGVKKLKGSG